MRQEGVGEKGARSYHALGVLGGKVLGRAAGGVPGPDRRPTRRKLADDGGVPANASKVQSRAPIDCGLHHVDGRPGIQEHVHARRMPRGGGCVQGRPAIPHGVGPRPPL
jgi:hypothetical protein